jgi:acetyl-CoA carboxylase biotin carboxyl carrier protein
VEEDTVVGTLETMKLFNSVHANVRGVVVEFLVDDAEPADQDAVIVLVRPEG